MKILVTTFAILTMAVSGTASSSIIDNGLYTTDTQSGLDWLDLSDTVGLSYDYVSNQLDAGGDFEGWHYANGDQFNDLWSTLTGTTLDGTYGYQYANNSSALESYQNIFGITREFFDTSGQQPIVTDRQSLGLISDDATPGRKWAASILDDTLDDSNDYFKAHSMQYGLFETRDYLGSWLVRDTAVTVPEPSIIALFSFGLVGMTFIQRKNKRNKQFLA